MCRQAGRDARWLMILVVVLTAMFVLPSVGTSAVGDPTNTSRTPVVSGSGGGSHGGGDEDSSDPDDLGIYKRVLVPPTGANEAVVPGRPNQTREETPIRAFWFRLLQELRVLVF